MLGISRSPLTESGYNSISLFFFNYFFALPRSLTEVPCLSLGQTQTWGSFIAGRCLCWSFLLPPAWQALVLPALPGNAAASRRLWGEPRVPNPGAGRREMLRNVFFCEHQPWDFA